MWELEIAKIADDWEKYSKSCGWNFVPSKCSEPVSLLPIGESLNPYVRVKPCGKKIGV